MTKPNDRPPVPPDTIVLPDLVPFEGAALEPEGDYDGLEFADLDLGEQAAENARFRDCRFERCRLDGFAMPRSRVLDCLLVDTHASAVDATESTWRDSIVSGGRIGAFTASGAVWAGIRMRGTKLNFVDLTTARLTDVVFESCVVGELDVGDAQLHAVRFVDCTIDDLNVDGARLTRVDLSRATLRVVRGIASLRGATVGRDQLLELAPLLADHLGIEVVDV